MNEKTVITIFVTVFITLYGLMHLFAFNQLCNYFGLEKNWIFYVCLAVATLSFVLASMLEANFGNILTRILYIISATWMGFIVLLFFALVLLWIAGFFVALPGIMTGTIVIAFTTVLCIYGMLNVGFVKISEVKIYSSKVHKPISIVQLSDFHLGPVHDKRFLEKAIYHTNKLNPDFVVITGDLADGRYKYDYFSLLDNIKADTYFVTGNHDTYAGIDRILSLIRKTKVKILRNESMERKDVQIIGIDDAEDKAQVEKQLKNIVIDKKKYSILLYHRPDGFSYAKGIDLMLSGHTHSGQFIPFNTLAYWANGYLQGLYTEDNRNLYVSAGVGTWGPPMRIGSRSEIVHIMIYPE